MSIAAVSSTQPINLLDPTTSPTGGVPSALQALVGNFNSLGQSLQAGDLAGAQQAFAALLQSAPAGGAGSTASPGAGSDAGASAGADLVSLGQALQSGNLAGAQQAFTKLTQAMHSAAPTAGGPSKSGGGASSSASDASTTVTSQVTTPNGNGTITVVTTYADGSTSTTIEQDPSATNNTTSTKPLDQSNAAQLLTLLGAQEQTQTK